MSNQASTATSKYVWHLCFNSNRLKSIFGSPLIPVLRWCRLQSGIIIGMGGFSLEGSVVYTAILVFFRVRKILLI
jgi:hypothetical protein